MSARVKPDHPQSNVSVVMETVLKEALEKLAKENQRTLSGEMRLALLNHVKAHA